MLNGTLEQELYCFSLPLTGNRYWYRQHDPNWKTKTYQYHRDTYGEDFNYDDFIANFTADAYDPKEWVDLIADAGAMYMIPVTSTFRSVSSRSED